MSLTSLISNLFSTNPTTDLAPVDGHNHIKTVGGQRTVHNAELWRQGTDVSDRHAMEEEEESRPPYLHVRCPSFSFRKPAAELLTTERSQC